MKRNVLVKLFVLTMVLVGLSGLLGCAHEVGYTPERTEILGTWYGEDDFYSFEETYYFYTVKTKVVPRAGATLPSGRWDYEGGVLTLYTITGPGEVDYEYGETKRYLVLMDGETLKLGNPGQKWKEYSRPKEVKFL